MESNVTPDIKNDIGVYVVQNNDTKETYVGSGILGKRKNVHSRLLESNTHWNSNLQEAYNRNPNFEFIGVSLKDAVSVEEQRENALALEQLLIGENNGNPLLLNKFMRVGKTLTGFKHTPENNKRNSERLFALVMFELWRKNYNVSLP